MKKHLIRYLAANKLVLGGIPFAGLFSDFVESEYFKQFLAQYVTSVVNTIGTSVVRQVVESIFY